MSGQQTIIDFLFLVLIFGTNVRPNRLIYWFQKHKYLNQRPESRESIIETNLLSDSKHNMSCDKTEIWKTIADHFEL